MAEVTIVGGGLAGMTAAINLAKRGRDVVVLERESRIGGSPLYHPSGQGSPLRLDALHSYLGFDITPGIEPIREMTEIAGGKALRVRCLVPIPISSSGVRGPPAWTASSTSWRKKRGWSSLSTVPSSPRSDLAQLPADTIVATGLHFEGFDITGSPYLTSHHFTYKGTCDADLNFVHMWHDTFTSDYGYTSASAASATCTSSIAQCPSPWRTGIVSRSRWPSPTISRCRSWNRSPFRYPQLP